MANLERADGETDGGNPVNQEAVGIEEALLLPREVLRRRLLLPVHQAEDTCCGLFRGIGPKGGVHWWEIRRQTCDSEPPEYRWEDDRGHIAVVRQRDERRGETGQTTYRRER